MTILVSPRGRTSAAALGWGFASNAIWPFLPGELAVRRVTAIGRALDHVAISSSRRLCHGVGRNPVPAAQSLAGLDTSTTPSRTRPGPAGLQPADGEAGADGTDLGIARRHHKGAGLGLGDIEQRFALHQFDAAHGLAVIHLDFGRGVEGDDRAVFQRHHLGLALAGDKAAAMAQHPATCRPPQPARWRQWHRPIAAPGGGGRQGPGKIPQGRTGPAPEPVRWSARSPACGRTRPGNAHRHPARPGTAFPGSGGRGRRSLQTAHSAAWASIWCSVL